MKLKNKIILTLASCLIAVGSIIHFGLAERSLPGDITLADITMMAQASGEQIDYSVGYINDPQPCVITETVTCTIGIPFYLFGTLYPCTVNFSYTIEHEGTSNYCKYTGGPSGCSFHVCQIHE